MTKTYPERLGEWVKQRDSTKRDRNLVAFLAVRDEVRAAVEAGYPVKTIWENMLEEKRIAFGYDTFLKYVNRYIRRAPELRLDAVKPKPAVAPSVQLPVAIAKEPGMPRKAPASIPGFTFNSAPKKEDLI
jgi:hypothetical protein